MKKSLLIVAPAIALTLCFGCNKKMNPTQKQGAAAVNEADYVPFTKSLKMRLERDHADMKRIQFYVDQSLVLRRTNGMDKGVIKNGTVAYDNSQTVTEMTIPAYTPGVCEGVKGDSLLISFDSPGNTFVFGALYANENFVLLGSNWYNGVTDVNYDGKIYRVACGSCSNAGDARLVIKRPPNVTSPRESGGTKIIAGRKVK